MDRRSSKTVIPPLPRRSLVANHEATQRILIGAAAATTLAISWENGPPEETEQTLAHLKKAIEDMESGYWQMRTELIAKCRDTDWIERNKSTR